MIDDSTVVLISYPSGGFGNFLYHALTEHSSNTAKALNSEFKFNSAGNSHQTQKYTKVYFNDPAEYDTIISDYIKTTLILCDNVRNIHSYRNVRKIFPTAQIVRATISEAARPIVYQTCIIKASQSCVLSETADIVKSGWTDSEQDYAARENFTLLYHNWMFNWEPIDNVINVNIEQLVLDPVQTLCNLIVQLGGQVVNKVGLVELCQQWNKVNLIYFEVYFNWIKIEQALDSNNHIDVSNITSLHEQGYLNYCIEKKFNVIIPVYDYRNWFNTTSDIIEMVKCLK